ncbi:MAG: hypothetical protein Kow0069_04070 [Promethearchaeota archaeon]
MRIVVELEEELKKRASRVLVTQAAAVGKLAAGREVVGAALEVVNAARGSARVVTTGMGKAGIIAGKMSATLASIGVPSFFVHPAEALHGDVGRVAPGDLLVVFSHSGKTTEVVAMVNALDELNDGKNRVVLVSGNERPAFRFDVLVCYGPVEESCVVSKVPTTSTTVMLVLADAIAVSAAEVLGLNDEWFEARHPGGAIGTSYKELREKSG